MHLSNSLNSVLYIQTEKTVHPITALIEATIRVELGNTDFAEQVLIIKTNFLFLYLIFKKSY